MNLESGLGQCPFDTNRVVGVAHHIDMQIQNNYVSEGGQVQVCTHIATYRTAYVTYLAPQCVCCLGRYQVVGAAHDLCKWKRALGYYRFHWDLNLGVF